MHVAKELPDRNGRRKSSSGFDVLYFVMAIVVF